MIHEEDVEKTIAFLKREKYTTPTKLGVHLGKYTYDATSFACRLLKHLIEKGKVKKEGWGKDVKYSLLSN